MTVRFTRVACIGIGLAALISVGCGDSSEPTPAPEPTSTPVLAIQEIPAPIRTVEVPPPPAKLPETPAPAIDDIAVAEVESPRVLWMRSEHAGPGVVVIRFATNVETTAEVRVNTEQAGPEHFFSEALETAATEHSVSVPANFGRYTVRVENADGEVAWGELRYKKDPEGVDWATGLYAPDLVALTSKQLRVTWSFISNHPSHNGLVDSVYVFATDAECTTADACVGEAVGAPIEPLVKDSPKVDSMTAEASIMGADFDYKVIVAHPLNDEMSTMIFMQLEIRGDQLPKTKFTGPGDIKVQN